jgi:hypothetical protein
VQEPGPRSRPLCAGHRLASQQAPARLIPGPQTVPGFAPRTAQTAEGELEIEIPQVREAAEPFASSLFPRARKLGSSWR